MLERIRNSANSWLIVPLFGIIIFVFAINLGLWRSQFKTNPLQIASVNNQIITYSEFQRSYNEQINLLIKTQKETKLDKQTQEKIKHFVIQNLISKLLILQLAKREGFLISDKDLANYIKNVIFSKETWKDYAAYERAIYSALHINAKQFEVELRKDLIVNYMVKFIEKCSSESQGNQFLKQYIDFLKVHASIKLNLD